MARSGRQTTTARRRKSDDIYGDVNSPEDIRKINDQIRKEMESAKSRDELTELKRRSDYLCTLTRAPSWKKKFGDRVDQLLVVAKEENRKTVELAKKVARQHGWDADYDPWGE